MTDQDDLAPQDVQDQISALLRSSARTSDVSTQMPADVEQRIRSALAQERPISRTSTPPTVVPLPARRESPRETQSATTSSEAIELPRQHTATTPSIHSVASLEAHREKRSGRRKLWMGLSAAAAVAVIGGATVYSTMSGTPTQDAKPTTMASRVSVTESDQNYTGANLSTQAATLTRENSYTKIADTPENRAKYGAMVAKEGINTCLSSLNALSASDVKQIHADFAMYESKPAVIVVVEKMKGGSEVWVVNNTCTRKEDKVAGPTPLTT